MLEHTKRQVHKKFYNMRCLVMFITAVCLLLLINKTTQMTYFRQQQKQNNTVETLITEKAM